MRGRGGTRCLEAGRGRRRGVCAYAPAAGRSARSGSLRNLEAPQMHILPYKRVHAHTHKHTHTRTDNKIEGTEPEEQRMRPVRRRPGESGRGDPCPSRGPRGVTVELRGRSDEGKERGSLETPHNDSTAGAVGFIVRQGFRVGRRGTRKPTQRSGRTHSKGNRGFMTIRLGPWDVPCRWFRRGRNELSDGGR